MIASLDPLLTRDIDLALGDPLTRKIELRGIYSIELPRDKDTCGVDISKGY